MAAPQTARRLPVVGFGTEFTGLDEAVSLSNLSRGTRLFSPGEAADRIFVLLSGRIKLAVVGPGGKHCLFHLVDPGEIFGEEALLGETTRNASCEVLEPAVVTMIPARAALRYVDGNSEFWTSLAPLLRKRMRHLEQQIQWVSFLEVEQRISRLILRWAESQGTREDGGMEFRLSQRDLAGMVGATRETTSSALNRLQREGVLEIRRRCVSVRSIDALRRHAGLEPSHGRHWAPQPVAELARRQTAGE